MVPFLGVPFSIGQCFTMISAPSGIFGSIDWPKTRSA